MARAAWAVYVCAAVTVSGQSACRERNEIKVLRHEIILFRIEPVANTEVCRHRHPVPIELRKHVMGRFLPFLTNRMTHGNRCEQDYTQQLSDFHDIFSVSTSLCSSSAQVIGACCKFPQFEISVISI